MFTFVPVYKCFFPTTGSDEFDGIVFFMVYIIYCFLNKRISRLPTIQVPVPRTVESRITPE